MNIYESIEKEETKVHLQSLIKHTTEGKLAWICTDYNPIGLLHEIDDEGKDEAKISQCFIAQTNLNGIDINIEIWDRIDLLSGKGEISGEFSLDVTLERVHEFNTCEDIIFYEEQDTETVNAVGRKSLAAILADILIPHLVSSEPVAFGFSFARFNPQSGVPKRFLRLPLCKLSEKLMKERKPLDFHRVVLDMEYRSRLLYDMTAQE